MKILNFISILALFLSIISCKQHNSEDNNKQSHMMNDSTMINHDSTAIHNKRKMMDNSKTFSCPMHPEVRGSENDKCPKCGMDLEQMPT